MKIRTRIFLVFAILIGIGIFTLVNWMHGEMRPRYMEAQEDTLVDLSQLLASIISTQAIKQDKNGAFIDNDILKQSFSNLKQRNIDAQIYQIRKEHVDIRIYVTDKNGLVIFDSDNQRDIGQDYSQWRDVNRSLKGEYGARSTEADPLYPEGSTMYIAAPIIFNTDIIGSVSVGKPTRNAERFMKHLLDNITTVGLLITAIAILIGLFIHTWVSRPLARLQQYAVNVTEGEHINLPELGNNEVGQVGAAMEKMRMALDGKSYVSEYVQSLTHELKSPIAAIRGASELMSEDMPTEERKHFLKNIVNETLRMQELIDRLLELAAIEYRPELSLDKTLELKAILEEVINSLQSIAAGKKISMNLSSRGQSIIKGDEFLLSKAFNNILKNAIDFSPENSNVIINVSGDSKTVSVSICDEGPGIPDYAKEKIFERFYSLAKPNGQKGSGLGLSFVKEIAMLHKAEITVENNDGQGTKITVVLPSANE